MIESSIYYLLTMLITVTFISFFQRGFFWKYWKVRTSFGKHVLVKIRNPLTDYFEVGWVENGCLCYKHKKVVHRIDMVEGTQYFYRGMAVGWVDVDDEKNAIAKSDYSVVPGFDTEKFENLLIRALTRPSLTSKKDLIMIICLVVIVLCSFASLFLLYRVYQMDQAMLQNLPGMIRAVLQEGAVVRPTGVI